tara:strand:- start:2436 stop:2939 length:504 start_codon:yes stop_codon:yes gene_type:complete
MKQYCNICNKIETELRCQKCNELICYECITETPVGYRCNACVSFNIPPMYKMPIHLIISSLIIGIMSGIIIGYIISMLMPVSSIFSLFTLAAATFIAILVSSIIFSILNFTTNGKRGKKIQIVSITSMMTVMITRIYISGEISLVTSDLNGAVLLLISTLLLWDKFK